MASTTPSHLCRVCFQIPTLALECPSFGDLANKEYPPERERFLNLGPYPPSIPCGTLGRIRQSAPDCGLCRLIWSIIVRDNYGEEPSLCDESSGGRQKECWVYVTPYGQFSEGDQSVSRRLTRNLIRRLSLRVGVPPSNTEDDSDCLWQNIYFCMQTCAIAGVSLSPKDAWCNKTEPTAVAFGGRLRPLQVDLDWIRQWLTICLNEHGEQCSSPAVSNDAATGRATLSVPDQREFANIRLINVILNCIETFQHDQCDDQRLCPPYVALSYVWGHDQPLKLQIGNEHTLSRPGALLRDRPTLTITDAMELLSRLSWPGVQHLWVDALCIIQDSDDDKKRQIGNMAQIYTNAAFTIVAAAGEDAAAGLPGLHAGTRSVTQTAVLLSEPERAVYPFDSLNCYGTGFAVMNTLNPLPALDHDYWTLSRYSTRGWTMQERLLSRRNLVFTEEQVYYQCPSAVYCEESHFESHLSRLHFDYGGASQEAKLPKNMKGWAQGTDTSIEETWNAFIRLAGDFSLREFTNEGDVLDGFAGIAQAISQSSGETFKWGMPGSCIELAILWHHLQRDYDSRDTTSIGRRLPRTTLPVSNLQQRLRLPSWDWLGWRGLIHFPMMAKAGAWIPETVCYVHRQGGDVMIAISEEAKGHTRYEWPAEALESPHRTKWEGSVDRTVTPKHVATQLPDLQSQLSSVPENLVLFFWTSISAFRMYLEDDKFKILSPVALNFRKGPVIDGQQLFWVGSLFAGGDREWHDSLHERHGSRVLNSFVVVGRIPFAATFTLIVMWIGFRGEVAMRCGLGTINEEAWVASQPEWELIALG